MTEVKIITDAEIEGIQPLIDLHGAALLKEAYRFKVEQMQKAVRMCDAHLSASEDLKDSNPAKYDLLKSEIEKERQDAAIIRDGAERRIKVIEEIEKRAEFKRIAQSLK